MKRLSGIAVIVVTLFIGGAFLAQAPQAFMRTVSAPKSGVGVKPTSKQIARAQETWKARKLEK